MIDISFPHTDLLVLRITGPRQECLAFERLLLAFDIIVSWDPSENGNVFCDLYNPTEVGLQDFSTAIALWREHEKALHQAKMVGMLTAAPTKLPDFEDVATCSTCGGTVFLDQGTGMCEACMKDQLPPSGIGDPKR